MRIGDLPRSFPAIKVHLGYAVDSEGVAEEVYSYIEVTNP